jgi:hypothetical protein
MTCIPDLLCHTEGQETLIREASTMKRNLFRVFALLVGCGVLSGVLAGCAWSIGDGKDRVTTNQPTRGQELIDLQKAKDQGAITQEEYDRQKKQILAR